MIRLTTVSFQGTILSAVAVMLLMVSATAATGMINALDYGALGDGTTLNTAAFEKAVAACVKQKGGTILVPAGVYRTGPIQLQSHVTLQLEAGATVATPSVKYHGNLSCDLLQVEDSVVGENNCDCEPIEWLVGRDRPKTVHRDPISADHGIEHRDLGAAAFQFTEDLNRCGFSIVGNISSVTSPPQSSKFIPYFMSILQRLWTPGQLLDWAHSLDLFGGLLNRVGVDCCRIHRADTSTPELRK